MLAHIWHTYSLLTHNFSTIKTPTSILFVLEHARPDSVDRTGWTGTPCSFYSTSIFARAPSFLPPSPHTSSTPLYHQRQSSSPPRPSAGPAPQQLGNLPCRQQQHCALYSSGRDVDKGPHSAYWKVGQSWASAFWSGASCSWPFPQALQALGR